MTNNEIQYTIYIRSTKESIPVSKEEFDAYYHDINIYRIRQQRHGRCVCPASKRLTCDMDCLTCPFHRMGDKHHADRHQRPSFRQLRCTEGPRYRSAACGTGYMDCRGR